MPAGPQSGERSLVSVGTSPPVSGCASVPSGLIVQRRFPVWKTIRFPSGDQPGSRSNESVFVTGTWSEPSALIT